MKRQCFCNSLTCHECETWDAYQNDQIDQAEEDHINTKQKIRDEIEREVNR